MLKTWLQVSTPTAGQTPRPPAVGHPSGMRSCPPPSGKVAPSASSRLLFIVRIPEPQKPQPKPPEDVVRSNHYDPEDDEEYYRKQLSYFDRRGFENKPSAHTPAGQLSDPSKLVHPQGQPNFSSYSSK